MDRKSWGKCGSCSGLNEQRNIVTAVVQISWGKGLNVVPFGLLSRFGIDPSQQFYRLTFNWTVLGFPMPPYGGPPAVRHIGGMYQLIS
jgi:hypothetical protein